MGTYLKVQLKNTSENHIKKVNGELAEMGYETPVYDNIPYGAFVTRERLDEDARFMNEDPEGLKQVPHWPRPVTRKDLMDLIWNRIGFCQIKLSGGVNGSVKLAMVVAKWVSKNSGLIDKDKSDNYGVRFVKSYLDPNED